MSFFTESLVIPSLLQRYVLREIVAVVAVAALALTAIFFLGFSVSYARNGLSIVQLYYVIPYVFMLSLPYALPAAFLLGSVLVFGRLSGRFEIDAMRASGVNLYHVILAPLALALAVCGGTFFMNHYLFPWTMTRLGSLRDRLILDVVQRYGLKQGFEVKPYFIYIGGADPRDNSWKNVAVIQFAGEIPSRIMVAQKGIWRLLDARTAALRLMGGRMLEPKLSAGDQQRMVSFKDMIIHISLDGGGGPDLGRPKYLSLFPLLAEIRKRGAQIIFQAADTNGDGFISKAEFENFFNQCTGTSPSPPGDDRAPDPGRFFRVADTRGSGELTLQQFSAALEKMEAAGIRVRIPHTVSHPRSTEWKTRSELEAAEEECATRANELNARKKVLDAAGVVMAKQETEVKAAQAAWDNASQQSRDAKALLAGQPEYLKKLESDIQNARDEGDARERLADLEAERKRTAGRVSQLTARAEQAEKELQSRAAALQAAATALQADKENCAKAQASCDEAAAAARTAEKTRAQIWEIISRLKTVERWIEAKSEFNFRNAGAMTCLVFTLVGIPLGIFTRRGTVLAALAVSFAAVLFVHYPLLMIGDTLADDGYLAPWIANWMADGVMGCLGVALLVWGVKR